MSYLACPTAIHEEIKSSPHRVRTETVAAGVQSAPGMTVYLRNCNVCLSTLGVEIDVDVEAQARETD
jgi:cytochrome c5